MNQKNDDERIQLLDHRPSTRNEILGLISISMSSFAVNVASTFVKLASKVFPTTQILFVRFIIQASLSLFGCYQLGIHPLACGRERKWVLIRGIVGAFSSIFLYYSLERLSLADVVVITNMHPMFAALFAAILLNEPFGWFERACAALCMTGAILVTKPSFMQFSSLDNETRTLGLISALLGAICSAAAYVCVRKAGSDAHYFSHMLSLALVNIAFNSLDFHHFVLPFEIYPYGLLFGVVSAAFVGQCLLNRGLQLAPAGPGTLMCMNEIVFAFLFGIFIFDDFPDYLSILGAAIIIVASTALGWKKWSSP
ncbi:hypothetical protein BJV82DRAFT_643125 [Fennellomyces sp. T-0311]|nr:hypothetical protein BJV82DRAFT_643125 [Fennellomyces sp. T-0311]